MSRGGVGALYILFIGGAIPGEPTLLVWPVRACWRRGVGVWSTASMRRMPCALGVLSVSLGLVSLVGNREPVGTAYAVPPANLHTGYCKYAVPKG